MNLNKIKNNFIKAGYDFQRFEDHVKKSVQSSMDGDGDLLPPWLKYPETHPRKVFWRMGKGQDYITLFDMWRLSLTENETLGYIEKYPNLGEWEIFCTSRHKKWIAKNYKNCPYCGSDMNAEKNLCQFCNNDAEYSGLSAKDYIAVRNFSLTDIEKK